jgi:hypothetical protein
MYSRQQEKKKKQKTTTTTKCGKGWQKATKYAPEGFIASNKELKPSKTYPNLFGRNAHDREHGDKPQGSLGAPCSFDTEEKPRWRC